MQRLIGTSCLYADLLTGEKVVVDDYFSINSENCHDTVQFSPLTDWVVGGTWGTIRQRSFYTFFFLQEALLNSSGTGRDVHSLMLSIQHFLCQPQCPERWFWRGCRGMMQPARWSHRKDWNNAHVNMNCVYTNHWKNELASWPLLCVNYEGRHDYDHYNHCQETAVKSTALTVCIAFPSPDRHNRAVSSKRHDRFHFFFFF